MGRISYRRLSGSFCGFGSLLGGDQRFQLFLLAPRLGGKLGLAGGFGSQVAAELPVIDAYEPDLVLDGLRIIHERNRDAKP